MDSLTKAQNTLDYFKKQETAWRGHDNGEHYHHAVEILAAHYEDLRNTYLKAAADSYSGAAHEPAHKPALRWKNIDDAPRDGTWIYGRVCRFWRDKQIGEVEIVRMRWLMLCPKRGGELLQGGRRMESEVQKELQKRFQEQQKFSEAIFRSLSQKQQSPRTVTDAVWPDIKRAGRDSDVYREGWNAAIDEILEK